ncbi:unnamed protein product [Sphagnum troendelagicum]|uniref:Secreted protein n=1 Tax=Sphagnum troendelagicum TaxID=128251 RepID=A0ABP0UD51_9BRYO
MVATSLAVVVVRLVAGCSSFASVSSSSSWQHRLPCFLPRILRQISAPESHSRLISTLFSLSDLHSYSRTTIPQSVDTSWTPSLVPSQEEDVLKQTQLRAVLCRAVLRWAALCQLQQQELW